jgi:hypothetical protein
LTYSSLIHEYNLNYKDSDFFLEYWKNQNIGVNTVKNVRLAFFGDAAKNDTLKYAPLFMPNQ